MGQPRASRRRVVTISSDEDEEDTTSLAELTKESAGSEEDTSRPESRKNGQLQSIKTARKPQKSTSTSSTQDPGSQSSPKKAKASKAKPQPVTKDETKAKAKPIYSFFNAATQKQQSSQPTTTQPRSSTPRRDTETIDSDDDKTSAVTVSKGSSTALAVRKRKLQSSQHPEDDALLPPSATQKFRKTGVDSRTPSFSVINEDKRSWVEQFSPLDLSELAVHKRKVADVKRWLEVAYAGRRQRVLVLKGSAGTGKTTTINLLARDMGIDVMEWKNPAGNDYLTEGSATAAAQFNEFVARAGKTASLVFGASDDAEFDQGVYDSKPAENPSVQDRQLLLIEEFPNTFSRMSPVLQSFRIALSQYLASATLANQTSTPIVLIVSETLLSTNTPAADSFTTHRLLGPELLNHPYLDTIEFNAIAPTILTKALEAIVLKEARKSGRRKTPGSLVLKHLADSGDIRSAISTLEFLCLRGDDGDTWSSKVAFTKPKKAKAETTLTKAEEEALKLISNRESSLGIFHSVGKVVYNKRTDPPPSAIVPQPPPWLPQHRRNKVPETNVDRLIDELGTDTTTFVASLHENYALSCNTSGSEETLDSISGCIDNISDADLLCFDRFAPGARTLSGSSTDTLRQDEMSFQVAVRGVLFNLPNPVNRGIPASGRKADSHRMFYPASLKLWRKVEEIEGLLDLLTSKAQRGDLDSASRLPSKPTASTGASVAGWKREDPTPADGGIPAIASTSARREMLMERLPYMLRILGASNRDSTALEQINSVVHIQSTAPASLDNDDEEMDIDSEHNESGSKTDLWSTDRPDADSAEQRLRGTKKKARNLAGRVTEGGGLGIAVENCVEKLVLEDDDIVDD